MRAARFGLSMKANISAFLLAVCLVAVARIESAAGQSATVIKLWPAGAPGTNGNIGVESDTTKPTDGLVAGKTVIRLGNVATPSLTLYRPPRAKDSGAAVMVCPGGGYHILAMDLEGTEVCAWLNSIGITGALLKYRVPKREGEERSLAALQDAQRALSLLRHRATGLGIDPKRIGVIGFSAGGHLAAALSSPREQRNYPQVDAADMTSSRPDFCLLIYPAYLTRKEANDNIAPELNITSNTPPTFIAMAQDDPIRVETAMFYALGLRRAGVPFELHIYPTGGHGYGLRRTKDNVTTWPERAAEWLRSRGLLDRPSGTGRG
jgi:acetyl esterase/lipase